MKSHADANFKNAINYIFINIRESSPMYYLSFPTYFFKRYRIISWMVDLVEKSAVFRMNLSVRTSAM